MIIILYDNILILLFIAIYPLSALKSNIYQKYQIINNLNFFLK